MCISYLILMLTVCVQILEIAIGEALDWQWDDYLVWQLNQTANLPLSVPLFCLSLQSIQLPLAYKEELAGLRDGAAAAGCPDCGNMAGRAIALSNMPGDIQDYVLVLLRELNKTKIEDWPRRLQKSEESNMHW